MQTHTPESPNQETDKMSPEKINGVLAEMTQELHNLFDMVAALPLDEREQGVVNEAKREIKSIDNQLNFIFMEMPNFIVSIRSNFGSQITVLARKLESIRRMHQD